MFGDNRSYRKNRTAQAAAKKKQLTGSSREIDVIASTA
jgi:hypothetical protein